MYKLVLLRHGESLWNQENRFTGWVDVDLSPKGLTEAQKAGLLLKNGGFQFDVAYTSVLKRAIRTLWISLDAMDQMWIPVIRDWRLNERHYGALQGLNKKETVDQFGEDQVFKWRRSYDLPPPPMKAEDPGHPSRDRRYKGITSPPSSEALKNTQERFLPLWNGPIKSDIRSGKNVLIVAHGNSLRALVQLLDGLSKEAICELNIPTGIPLVYELDENLKPLRHYYLGDPEEAQKAAEAVARQLSKK